MNSDELDSEDLDNLEKFGKLPNKEGQKHTKNDIKVSTGFSEDIGKKLIKKKHEHSTEKTGKLTEFQKWQQKVKERKQKKRQAAEAKKIEKKKMSKMTEE